MKHFFEVCLDIRLVMGELAGLIGFAFLLWRLISSEWKKR